MNSVNEEKTFRISDWEKESHLFFFLTWYCENSHSFKYPLVEIDIIYKTAAEKIWANVYILFGFIHLEHGNIQRFTTIVTSNFRIFLFYC